MKLLAIHSNSLFFGEALNFYQWLAKERGLVERYKPLGEKYDQGKVKGPLLLKETYELAAGGLTHLELTKYCQQYCEKYLSKEIISNLSSVMKKMRVLVFSSYPHELYEVVKNKNMAHKAFGAKGAVNAGSKMIMDFAPVKLDNVEVVKAEMNKIGLGNKFTFEPNRFGMLECLIDEMIKNGVTRDDVVVLGKGDTAKPMHKVAGRVIENLSQV